MKSNLNVYLQSYLQGDHFPDHMKFPDCSSIGKQRLPGIELGLYRFKMLNDTLNDTKMKQNIINV